MVCCVFEEKRVTKGGRSITPSDRIFQRRILCGFRHSGGGRCKEVCEDHT